MCVTFYIYFLSFNFLYFELSLKLLLFLTALMILKMYMLLGSVKSYHIFRIKVVKSSTWEPLIQVYWPGILMAHLQYVSGKFKMQFNRVETLIV